MLQWYCLKRDAQLGSLRVLDAAAAPPPPSAGRSGESSTPTPPLEGHVAHFALSLDGTDLATLERRCEAGGGELVETLRFWELPAVAEDGEAASEDGPALQGLGGGAPFLLRTRVETPHASSTAALAHSPSTRLVATAGGDAAEFRLWQRGRAPAGPASSWRCRSVGFFQSRPMHALAFSADGAWAKNRMTLKANSQVQALCLPFLPATLPPCGTQAAMSCWQCCTRRQPGLWEGQPLHTWRSLRGRHLLCPS